VTAFSRIQTKRPLAGRTAKRGLTKRASAVEGVVSSISGCIVQLTAMGFTQTADILAIARLDLLAQLHGVSDAELECLITAQHSMPAAPIIPDRVKALRARPSRKIPLLKDSPQNKSR